jgi:uncharacterized protein
MRRLLKLALLVSALGYAGAAAYLMLNEQRLVFHPAERAVPSPPAHLALRERTVTFSATDGTRLSAWIVPAARADSSGMWLLICHGNYGNIGYGKRPEFMASMRDLGVNLFAFDYRGFGASEGSPEEKGLYADAMASYRYLTDSLRVPPEQIVIFGHSLGSGVAVELATQVAAAALVVEGAYTSVPDRGQEIYPALPVRLLASQRFASLDKIERVAMPKLFLHSPEDVVIPFAHGQRLFAAAKGPKRFVSVRGGHDDAFRADKAVYYGSIAQLLQEVAPSAAATALAPTR